MLSIWAYAGVVLVCVCAGHLTLNSWQVVVAGFCDFKRQVMGSGGVIDALVRSQISGAGAWVHLTRIHFILLVGTSGLA